MKKNKIGLLHSFSSSTFANNKVKKVKLNKTQILNEIENNCNYERYLAPRFHKFYKLIICKDFIYKQNLRNIMEIPKLKKLVISVTSKSLVNDKKYIIPALLALELISGQKLKLAKAKHSIASFKLRKNQLIGCKVTLQGKNMFYFLDKLITLILPRLIGAASQRGPLYNYFNIKTIDSQGNYNLGLNNLLLFPELENHFELFEIFRGMNISLITSTTKKQNSFLLLGEFQLPSQ
jgi:large subunit ribosomal protein L5